LHNGCEVAATRRAHDGGLIAGWAHDFGKMCRHFTIHRVLSICFGPVPRKRGAYWSEKVRRPLLFLFGHLSAGVCRAGFARAGCTKSNNLLARRASGPHCRGGESCDLRIFEHPAYMFVAHSDMPLRSCARKVALSDGAGLCLGGTAAAGPCKQGVRFGFPKSRATFCASLAKSTIRWSSDGRAGRREARLSRCEQG